MFKQATIVHATGTARVVLPPTAQESSLNYMRLLTLIAFLFPLCHLCEWVHISLEEVRLHLIIKGSCDTLSEMEVTDFLQMMLRNRPPEYE